jgi:hypothetical protein
MMLRRKFAIESIWLCAILVGRASGDELKINTPVVAANLTGRWELQPDAPKEFKQTLHLGQQFTGEWQKSRETLPVSIAWFVEGGELRLLHYYEPNGAFNYRVKTLMVAYTLKDDSLTLTFDNKPTTWKRVKESPPVKP